MNNKKTIIYFGNYDLIKRNASGNRVFFNSKILNEKYRVINVFYTKDNLIEKEKLIYYEGFEIYAINYPKSKYEWIKNFKKFKSIKFKLLEKNLDIHLFIFYHSLFAFFHTAFVIFYLKVRRIKILFDVVEFDRSLNKNLLLRLLRNIDFYFSEKIFPALSNGIIVISKRMVTYFKSNKTFLLPPLNDIKPFNSNKSGKLKILFAGTLGEVNNNRNLSKDRIDLIIRLVENYNQILLHIYGFDEKNFLEEFSDFTIPKNVRFLGIHPHKQILSVIKKYDFTIIYRMNTDKNNFGFPTKFSEAYSAHLPIITTPISDVTDYIINGLNGYLLPFEFEKAKIEFSKIIAKGRLKKINLLKGFKKNQFYYKSYKSKLIGFINKI